MPDLPEADPEHPIQAAIRDAGRYLIVWDDPYLLVFPATEGASAVAAVKPATHEAIMPGRAMSSCRQLHDAIRSLGFVVRLTQDDREAGHV